MAEEKRPVEPRDGSAEDGEERTSPFPYADHFGDWVEDETETRRKPGREPGDADAPGREEKQDA